MGGRIITLPSLQAHACSPATLRPTASDITKLVVSGSASTELLLVGYQLAEDNEQFSSYCSCNSTDRKCGCKSEEIEAPADVDFADVEALLLL